MIDNGSQLATAPKTNTNTIQNKGDFKLPPEVFPVDALSFLFSGEGLLMINLQPPQRMSRPDWQAIHGFELGRKSDHMLQSPRQNGLL